MAPCHLIHRLSFVARRDPGLGSLVLGVRSSSTPLSLVSAMILRVKSRCRMLFVGERCFQQAPLRHGVPYPSKITSEAMTDSPVPRRRRALLPTSPLRRLTKSHGRATALSSGIHQPQTNPSRARMTVIRSPRCFRHPPAVHVLPGFVESLSRNRPLRVPPSRCWITRRTRPMSAARSSSARMLRDSNSPPARTRHWSHDDHAAWSRAKACSI
jgi:hypothetical protein